MEATKKFFRLVTLEKQFTITKPYEYFYLDLPELESKNIEYVFVNFTNYYMYSRHMYQSRTVKEFLTDGDGNITTVMHNTFLYDNNVYKIVFFVYKAPIFPIVIDRIFYIERGY